MVDQYRLHIRKDFIVIRTVQKWNELLREMCVCGGGVCPGSKCWNMALTKALTLREFLASVSEFFAKCIQDGW